MEEERLRIEEEKEIARKLKGLKGVELETAKKEIAIKRQTMILEVIKKNTHTHTHACLQLKFSIQYLLLSFRVVQMQKNVQLNVQ